MTASSDVLFQPFRLKGLTLQNRIVMAPMTRNYSPGGVPGADVAAYYRRRAEDGVGLILTEGTVVAHPASSNSARVPRFHGADALAGWAHVLAEVRAVGGRIMPQLWHVGSMRKLGEPPVPEVPPVSPSGLAKAGRRIGEPMTAADIDAAIEAFAQGAEAAQRLGFDGIELHGAHGYLIDQFFWEVTNQRTDRYGGDLVARTRFAAEIVAECRRRTGPDFPILLRFSQWKQQEYTARLATTPDELARFLAPLVDAGVDLFHCSTRRFWEPEFPGSDLNLAGWTRKLSGKPAMTVGSVSLSEEFVATFQGASAGTAGIDRLLEMLARGDFDLVAVGRALLVDPAWTSKVRAQHFGELRPFTPEALKELV
jgi:2,4-dienoyl-CoA reductase-like NADH-dependent reductase (Old Yellow Enzyme family)